MGLIWLVFSKIWNIQLQKPSNNQKLISKFNGYKTLKDTTPNLKKIQNFPNVLFIEGYFWKFLKLNPSKLPKRQKHFQNVYIEVFAK